MEKLWFANWRKRLLENVKGNLLEVGVGTGKNLPYYNYRKVTVTAVDISERMLAHAQKLANKNGHPVKFQRVAAERLPFKDNTFDTVVCTFLLCSVADPVQSLKEMARVCKKKGTIVMIEHMLSKIKLIALWEHIHNPLTRFLFGFNVNRDTIANIKKAGLKIVKQRNVAFYDVFKELEVGT